jgi:branched-subunit amino acid aminotransferase/4-amino-4-deoxychorismate lyase
MAPIPTYILTPHELIPTPFSVQSLTEAVQYEPQGVYTLARTFHGDQAVLFNAHLDRLEESAQLMQIPFQLDRPRLRAVLRDLLHQANYPDAKLRLTVPHEQTDHIYISFEPFLPVPAPLQQMGVHMVTVPLIRENPVVKTTSWMITRRPAYDSLPEGVYEGILTREDGALLEGMSSNFYGILDGTLHTAGEGVLRGITRLAILEIAPGIVPVELTPIFKPDLARLTEAFLTSSGRGVVPITEIDGRPVGDGRVGPQTAAIRQRYDEWVEAHLETI